MGDKDSGREDSTGKGPGAGHSVTCLWAEERSVCPEHSEVGTAEEGAGGVRPGPVGLESFQLHSRRRTLQPAE